MATQWDDLQGLSDGGRIWTLEKMTRDERRDVVAVALLDKDKTVGRPVSKGMIKESTMQTWKLANTA